MRSNNFPQNRQTLLPVIQLAYFEELFIRKFLCLRLLFRCILVALNCTDRLKDPRPSTEQLILTMRSQKQELPEARKQELGTRSLRIAETIGMSHSPHVVLGASSSICKYVVPQSI